MVEKNYTKKMFGAGFIVAGAFFLAEHVYQFGFEYNDFWGHDWLGAGLILIGIILGLWSNKK